jgi:hypothetical protein
VSYLLLDYACPAGHRLESLESRPAPDSKPCPCGAVAERQMSAPAIRLPLVSVDHGSVERPPWAMDTRSLAEGESLDSWRKKRRAGRMDELRAGIVDPKIYV